MSFPFKMYIPLAVLVPLLLPFVSAHTTFTTLFVDGVNQGDGVCVRMNQSPYKASNPIEPVSSKNLACGSFAKLPSYDGEKGVSRVCPAEASSALTFEFRAYPDNSQAGSIDPSHKGPCAVYMKKVANPTADDNAAGEGWFKIYESTFDENAGKWCTEKLIENDGHLSVKIPEDIQAGYYLVRPELLALQSAQDHPPDPQFYVGCAQVFVKGTGSASPATVNIGEGTYDLSIPGLTFNIFESPMKLPYPMFGPPVYQSGSGKSTVKNVTGNGDGSDGDSHGSSAAGSTEGRGTCSSNCSANDGGNDSMDIRKSSPMIQTIGLKPEGCILVRDNWCGFEVPPYSDEEGCWDSSERCWNQSDVCWNTAPPTGPGNCNIWQRKCTELDDSCLNDIFNGPPHEGKELTPTPPPLNGEPVIFERDLHKREVVKRFLRRSRVHGHI